MVMSNKDMAEDMVDMFNHTWLFNKDMAEDMVDMFNHTWLFNNTVGDTVVMFNLNMVEDMVMFNNMGVDMEVDISKEEEDIIDQDLKLYDLP